MPVPGRKCGTQYVFCTTSNTEMGLISIMIFFTLLYFVLCAPSLAASTASHCSGHSGCSISDCAHPVHSQLACVYKHSELAERNRVASSKRPRHCDLEL